MAYVEVTQEQAMQLLNFESERIDVPVLDAVVNFLYGGTQHQQKMASDVLTQLRESDQAWTRVHQILEESENMNSKYFALQILERVVKTQWKALPKEQTEGIKNYVVQLIISLSSTFETLEDPNNKNFIGKLNLLLISIVKNEWPHNWPSFLPDIVGSSNANESLCQNNMAILLLLSEEVFDFSKGQITQVKAQHLKDTMCAEFAMVFELCRFVLVNSGRPTLIDATIRTLLRFLSWIPVGYVFETDLVPTLLKFLEIQQFGNITLKCLTEIASLKEAEFDPKQLAMFQGTLSVMIKIIPPSTNIASQYDDPSTNSDQQHFVQNLSLFLSTFLINHGNLLEAQPELHQLLHQSLHYMILISEVNDIENFKICLEYWHDLAESLYREQGSQSFSPLVLGREVPAASRAHLYEQVLTQVRLVVISKMAKPEEVLVVENDQGEVVREFLKDTDSIELYKSMRETLVYLTHLNPSDTERIMTEKLQRQVDGSEWSWKNLNTLCWAIGSISMAMNEDDEKRFLVTVIKDLLGLCENKRGKDHKAIIASDIMYIVGQYPRFLRAHWKFLKTVVNKLFEFMHERHEGVQDMACDTFIKIAKQCRKHFVQVQVGEVQPFVEEILRVMQQIVCDLQPHQVHTFYEAVGHMIAAQSQQTARAHLVEKLMLVPNTQWASIISDAARDMNVLTNPQVIKSLANILKTNVRACASIGHPFIVQLGVIYMDMLFVYKIISEKIANDIVTQGEIVTKQPVVRSMRTVKKEVLKLISTWISKSDDAVQVMENFVPPLLEAVLGDYESSIPAARDPEVLSTMATVVNTLKAHIASYVMKIFAAVFESTLSMINKDFETFPEHRTNFYLLLQSITSHCFEAYASLTEPQFRMVIDAIVWGFKHPMRDVAETSLKILKELLNKVRTSPPEFAQSFYQRFLVELLQHLFSVVTDTTHMSGLSSHSVILAHIFHLIESEISVPLDPKGAADNMTYMRQYVAELLMTAFPHLQQEQVQIIVEGFFSYDQDTAAFKDHLRDFLIQCKEVAGEDLTDLRLHEREAQLRQAQKDKQMRLQHIPGMMNPHQETSF